MDLLKGGIAGHFYRGHGFQSALTQPPTKSSQQGRAAARNSTFPIFSPTRGNADLEAIGMRSLKPRFFWSEIKANLDRVFLGLCCVSDSSFLGRQNNNPPHRCTRIEARPGTGIDSRESSVSHPQLPAQWERSVLHWLPQAPLHLLFP